MCLLSISLYWHHHYSRFSLSHLQPRTPEEFKPIVFSRCKFLYSREPVTDPDCYKKGYKSSVSQFTWAAFFLWETHHKGISQPKVGILINSHHLYLARLPNSIFHQHSYPTSEYYSNVIPPPGLKLLSLRLEIGASPISYRISPRKHFNIVSTSLVGWCDAATSSDIKSPLKQRYLS